SSVCVDQNGGSAYFLSFSADGRWLAESTGFRSVTPSDAGQKFSVADRFGFSSNSIVAVNSDASLVATEGSRDGVALWQADLKRKEFHKVSLIRPYGTTK